MLTPGTHIGPYELLGPLGAGAMGEVYRAHATRLGREVAIKVLPAKLAPEPDRLRRFEREARAMAALSHPNILAVFDVGTHEGQPYLVEELLEGETLRERLRRGALPATTAVELGAQVADGLAAAHGKGLVHRDLKPANLIVTLAEESGATGPRRPVVKLLDFGLARITDSDVQAPTLLTEVGMIKGPLPYMAPEQARGDAGAIDVRTDVDALGVILYEMLAGTRPYDLAQAALAEAFTRQALSIDARALGEDDPRYALKLENLANITYRRKDYDRALEMLERVRGIRARNLGDDHILVARTVANMAVVATAPSPAP